MSGTAIHSAMASNMEVVAADRAEADFVNVCGMCASLSLLAGTRRGTQATNFGAGGVPRGGLRVFRRAC
jgi:hypothetical protein